MVLCCIPALKKGNLNFPFFMQLFIRLLIARYQAKKEEDLMGAKLINKLKILWYAGLALMLSATVVNAQFGGASNALKTANAAEAQWIATSNGEFYRQGKSWYVSTDPNARFLETTISNNIIYAIDVKTGGILTMNFSTNTIMEGPTPDTLRTTRAIQGALRVNGLVLQSFSFKGALPKTLMNPQASGSGYRASLYDGGKGINFVGASGNINAKATAAGLSRDVSSIRATMFGNSPLAAGPSFAVNLRDNVCEIGGVKTADCLSDVSSIDAENIGSFKYELISPGPVTMQRDARTGAVSPIPGKSTSITSEFVKTTVSGEWSETLNGREVNLWQEFPRAGLNAPVNFALLVRKNNGVEMLKIDTTARTLERGQVNYAGMIQGNYFLSKLPQDKIAITGLSQLESTQLTMGPLPSPGSQVSPGFQFINDTDLPVLYSVDQVGCREYDVIPPHSSKFQPIESFWFTLKASIAPSLVKPTTWDCLVNPAIMVASVGIAVGTGGALAVPAGMLAALTQGAAKGVGDKVLTDGGSNTEARAAAAGIKILGGGIGGGVVGLMKPGSGFFDAAATAALTSGLGMGALAIRDAIQPDIDALAKEYTQEVTLSGQYSGKTWPFSGRDRIAPTYRISGGPYMKKLANGQEVWFPQKQKLTWTLVP